MDHSLENIERFVLGQMSEAETKAFEREIDLDDRLEKEVEKMRLISDAMEVEIENQLRAQLEKLQNKPRKSRNMRRRFYLSVAAAILLLLGVYLTYYYSQSNISLPQFAEAHYTGYATVELRSDRDIQDLSEGIALLRTDAQSEAIQWFEEFIADHPDDFESRFILADLLRRTDQQIAARDQFRQIAKSNSLIWQEKATWNEILLSAQYAWDNEAKERLKGLLEDPSHSYHNLAIKLARRYRTDLDL